MTRAGVAGNTLGTSFSDTASCPAGKVLLGGGGTITSGAGTYAQSLSRADLTASFASGATTWTASMVVRQAFAAQSSVTVTAYVICTV